VSFKQPIAVNANLAAAAAAAAAGSILHTIMFELFGNSQQQQ
jgi:hypothetical protein